MGLLGGRRRRKAKIETAFLESIDEPKQLVHTIKKVLEEFEERLWDLEKNQWKAAIVIVAILGSTDLAFKFLF